jgi:hypothetical protein
MGYKIIRLDEQLVQITVEYDTGYTTAFDLPIDDNGKALDGVELDAYILGLCPPSLINPVSNVEAIVNLLDAEYIENKQKETIELTNPKYNLAIEARDKKLSDSDWSQLSDAGLSELEAVVWQEYRQTLRDLPGNQGFPDMIIYPIAPNEEPR